ncbi:hypothetical protein [Nocardioides halotolerans]|jgi:hypothetical protein|uniref:hypothetical protein n=1 Tax=Nocardioides halotolerans TaxID=433660 RepID=UPI0012FC8488|nr:hypothetical protein [Nocardioides halotolerans]
MLLPDVGTVVNALPSLGISEDLANDVRAFLDESAGELKEMTPDNVLASAFGSSPASRQCSSDAHKARAHVAQALVDMGAALMGYGGVVTDLYKDVKVIDETAQADLTKKAAAADACIAPSFAAPSQCTLPGSSSEGS